MSQEVTEITFESLGLTKSLDKMTAKELRALIVAKIPSIVGATGMQKDDLVKAVKGVFGIVDGDGAVSPYKDQIFTIKKTIREMRVQKGTVEARQERTKLRRKINKLKKRSRRLARAL
ncbi:MAG: hypothetical protein Q7U56_06655 [Humidesulfovibrio sp.]|nr:hypothetical protein [Humidesulfovibrio sp.]